MSAWRRTASTKYDTNSFVQDPYPKFMFCAAYKKYICDFETYQLVPYTEVKDIDLGFWNSAVSN